MRNHPGHDPVFNEPTGRRWQRVRLGAILLGAGSLLTVIVLIVVALLPPSLQRTAALREAPQTRPGQSRARAAQRRQERSQMLRSLGRAERLHGTVPRPVAGKGAIGPRSGDSLMVGFYVNWGDNSFASLRAHAEQLDWVIAEWAYLARHADTIRLNIDAKVETLMQALPADRRPKVLMMVSNVDSGRQFAGAHAARVLADSGRRNQMARRLARTVQGYHLAGVTLDFEELPDIALPNFERFLIALRGEMGRGPLITIAIEPSLDSSWVRRFADHSDRLILMAYDENSGQGDPGPVASRRWYIEQLRRVLASVPPEKLIAGIAAYGYDWNDAGARTQGNEITVQETWDSVRNNHGTTGFDSAAKNPYAYWTSPDSVDHFAWYLDGVSAYDEIAQARALGINGHALWRLGSEDPSIWHAIGRHGRLLAADSLQILEPGYDVELRGLGELIVIRSTPKLGNRRIELDAHGQLDGEILETLPLPWVVEKSGARPHEIALTFDDGPDGRWTPMILDTLKSRNAPATFFVVGQHVLTRPDLTRRMVREGHEIGNHTYTHPNISELSPWRAKLEIDISARLIEAVIDQRTLLFRPPYFGDAEPTTQDELEPIELATRLGYLSVGTRVDGEDWKPIPAEAIVRNVLSNRWRGNVVLLHDGGGNRAETVAVLGRLIDSLRSEGDTIVSLAQLGGLPARALMPPIPPGAEWARRMELLAFSSVGAIQRAVYLLFYAAIILGMGRLVLILGLAAVQRFRRRPPLPTYTPPVSVVVPAYREESVIVATVESLLGQEYPGAIEIVIVDDGSPDNTYQVALDAYGTHPRVQVLTRPNGGKASALNTGIAAATGEIVICLDADTQFETNTVAELVLPLADPHVGAVAGNAKVGNRINLVTRWQALEYITSQNLDRRAFALLDCIMVVPGAVGAWRKALVLEAGGFSGATLAEDQDLTLALSRRGHRVAYADRAVAWTEAPDTFRGLAKQRFRWAYGTMQCAWKHRDLLFRRSAGTLGFVALPNVWLFQVVFSAIAPMADLLFLWSVVVIIAMDRAHGATYQLASLGHVVAWYALFLVVDWLAAVLAFLMEPGEDRRLTWLVFIQRFAYRQVMYWVVIRSMVAALRGRLVGWGKLERKATVELRST